jgi:hypothetical protein
MLFGIGSIPTFTEYTRAKNPDVKRIDFLGDAVGGPTALTNTQIEAALKKAGFDVSPTPWCRSRPTTSPQRSGRWPRIREAVRQGVPARP